MELVFDIMKDGSIRFSRSDSRTNEQVLKIASKLAPEKTNEIKEFLDCSDDIELLFGNEQLCG